MLLRRYVFQVSEGTAEEYSGGVEPTVGRDSLDVGAVSRIWYENEGRQIPGHNWDTARE